MVRKSRISNEMKIDAVREYLENSSSSTIIAKRCGVDQNTFRSWVKTYLLIGADALKSSSRNSSYSSELKVKAVEDYLAGKGSLEDIRSYYGLKSKTQLLSWIKKYNGHETIKSSGPGGQLMTKGRKTTFDERIEIVKHCIENNTDYNTTAEKYEVSYQQVYSWVRKYEKGGVEALEDRRGKQKSDIQMSEMDKLKAKNKLLEAEIRKKQMEIDFLKKLEELERGKF